MVLDNQKYILGESKGGEQGSKGGNPRRRDDHDARRGA